MFVRRALLAPILSSFLAACAGCGGGAVPSSSVPRPELEQAIDAPGQKKVLEDARNFKP